MRITPKTRTVAGLSLAAAVAGTVAIAPVQAQEASESKAPVVDTPAASSSPAATAAKADTGAIVRGINEFSRTLDKYTERTARPGSGSAHARYSTNGWTYTAVAYHPVNNRMYAISTGEDGKPAGHLLRMFQDRDGVSDLGALSLGADFPTNTIASAAFTSRGELVLFSGPKFRVLDLSKDKIDGEVKDAAAVRARAGELKLRDGIGNVGTPSAWASSAADGKAKELYAVSRDPEGAPYLWTLNIETGRVEIASLQVKPGLDLSAIEELNYAYTKADNTLVFADDEARSIEVRDGAVAATYFGGEIVDNYREIAYLPKGAGYKAVTEFAKPAPLPGEAAGALPAGEGINVYETAAPSIPTVIAERSEPTTSPTQAAAAEVEQGAPLPAVDENADRPVLFTVVDEKGLSRQGVDIDIEGTDLSAVTDKNGQASIDVPNVDVVANVDGTQSVVRASAQTHRVTLLADGPTTTVTTNAAGKIEAHKLAITVKDKNGNAVEGATVTGQVGDKSLSVVTNRVGLVEIDVPEGDKATLSLNVNKDGFSEEFKVFTDVTAASVQMEQYVGTATSTTSTTTTTRSTTGARFHDATIRVRVITEGGDPVQDAQIYSVDGLNIQTRGVDYRTGLTNQYGYVDVFIPGNTGNGQKVRLGVRTAPAGYKTVTQQVDRNDDGATLTLPKGPTPTSTKSQPQEILEVIKEVQPLIAALGGSAAIGAGLGGSGSTTTRTTSTSTTVAASNLASMSTGRTTSVPQSTSSRAVVVESTRTTSSVSVEVSEELANTGTPMQAVITLGVLSMLIGGAYVAMGRRREA
ncbi:hypothetical protein M5J20_08360 [Corynebacterium sp. TA-R-1]|uniref:LPXTG cell wall anchor domain-containing protein n=1 Tax=Corynebacterium stercoris TaxID=2943490 RepID=A0ABT1G2D7_9CORY|nr:hypothetical protein [Corynebacterium stercoris]MCP1388197.1 hypothetical protein [Corynebacterium stercoris]